MKFYQIIFLLFLMTNFVNSTTDCDPEGGLNPSGQKDCKDLNLDFQEDLKYCCFLKMKDGSNEAKTCIPLTDAEYKDIKQTIKKFEEEGGKVKDLDCKSIYLQFSLISLLFLIL